MINTFILLAGLTGYNPMMQYSDELRQPVLVQDSYCTVESHYSEKAQLSFWFESKPTVIQFEDCKAYLPLVVAVSMNYRFTIIQ